jgi:hypothetical protein
MTESIAKMNAGVPDIADLHEASFLAARLLVADADLQRVREDALLDVSWVILERRIGLPRASSSAQVSMTSCCT